MLRIAGSILLACTTLRASTEITPERLANTVNEPQNWMTYSGTYNAWRYSGLERINQTNVRKLTPV